jgi:hypothetical protein
MRAGCTALLIVAGKAERASGRASPLQMEVKNAQDKDEPWGRQAV